jgi:uncharacterized Zn finger protein
MDLHAVFDTLITRTHLEDLAGKIVFARGEAYFDAGAVVRLRITADRIKANVSGSETWRVELRDVGELDVDCNCPHSADGNVCKHVVAVGLAWLGEQATERREGKAAGKRRRRDTWQDIEQFLAAQSTQTLIDQLLDCAQRDDRLYQSLLLKAERARGGSGDVASAFHRAIEDATRISGFVDWREAASLAGDLDQLLISMRELLQPDTAAVLVELAEYAIERLENSMEQVDDSDGEIGGIVSDLGELHHAACRMAKPEPTALAERLFTLQTTLPFGICSFDAESYGKMLGRSGLASYRELAQIAWHKLKPPTDKDRYDTRRSTLTSIMESLARASGDIDELVAIKARDLSSGWRYLGIAEIWAHANQPDKALEWAERGLAAFPKRTDNRLRDFLVGIYLKHKRHDEALQLTWIQFEEQPSLELFRKLHDVTVTLKCWPQQRQRALAELANAVPRHCSDPYHYSAATGRTLRLSIALWENDLEAAWETVSSGGCDRRLMIELADKLAPARPNDAISLYQAVVPPIVEQTNNAAYEDATKLIRKIGVLLKALKQTATWGDYLAELRVRFKPKRNFIKLLDGVIRTMT